MANDSRVPASPVTFSGVSDMQELTRRLEQMREDVYRGLAGDTHTSNASHAWRSAVDPATGDLVTYYLRRGTWTEVARTAVPT